MAIITNTRGKIAALCPADALEAQLYSVPAATELDGLLRIVNKDTVTQNYSVAHCNAGWGNTAASNSDWLVYNQAIAPNTMHEISIHAGPTETVRIKSSSAAKISFHLSGNKKVVS